MRPTEFHRNFVVMQDVEYTIIEEISGKAIPKIGMLPVGSTVYLPETEEQLGRPGSWPMQSGLEESP